MAKKSKAKRKFTEEFKAEMVKLVLDGGRSVADVCREQGLGKSSVYQWVKQARVSTNSDPSHTKSEQRDRGSWMRRARGTPRRINREHRQILQAEEHMARIAGLMNVMRKAVLVFSDAERVVDDLEMLPQQDLERVLLHLSRVAELCDKLDEMMMVNLVTRVRERRTQLRTELIVLSRNFYTRDLWERLGDKDAASALRCACDPSQRSFLEALHRALVAAGIAKNRSEDLSTFKKRVDRMRKRQNELRFVR